MTPAQGAKAELYKELATAWPAWAREHLTVVRPMILFVRKYLSTLGEYYEMGSEKHRSGCECIRCGCGLYFLGAYDTSPAIPWVPMFLLSVLVSAALALFENRSVRRYLREVSDRIRDTTANRPSARYIKEAALSVTFLKQVRKQTAQARTFILLAIVGLVMLSYAFDEPRLKATYLGIYLVLVGLYVLLLIKDAVLNHRVTHGLFGTNAYEARVMIDFLLKNADKTDFTDGDGKLKRVFLPEQLREDHLRTERDVGVHA